MIDPQQLSAWSAAIGKMDIRHNRDLLSVFAADVNNELRIHALSGRVGDLTAEDVHHIFKRWMLSLQSAQRADAINKELQDASMTARSASGPDAYGKRHAGKNPLVAAIEENLSVKELPRVVTNGPASA